MNALVKKETQLMKKLFFFFISCYCGISGSAFSLEHLWTTASVNFSHVLFSLYCISPNNFLRKINNFFFVFNLLNFLQSHCGHFLHAPFVNFITHLRFISLFSVFCSRLTLMKVVDEGWSETLFCKFLFI